MKNENKSLRSSSDPGFTLTFLCILLIILGIAVFYICLAGV